MNFRILNRSFYGKSCHHRHVLSLNFPSFPRLLASPTLLPILLKKCPKLPDLDQIQPFYQLNFNIDFHMIINLAPRTLFHPR